MYKSILVPLDGSKRAEAILPHVENMASRYGARIIFLQVLQPLCDYQFGATPANLYQDVFEHNVKDANLYLSRWVGEFREKGLKADKVIEQGSIVETIIRVADKENANLIAVASHGLTGLSRVFYGSVSAGLLNRVDRPLLLIRSRGAKSV